MLSLADVDNGATLALTEFFEFLGDDLDFSVSEKVSLLCVFCMYDDLLVDLFELAIDEVGAARFEEMRLCKKMSTPPFCCMKLFRLPMVWLI